MSAPVNAPVDLVKAPSDRCSRDCLGGIAELDELASRNDPMLALGKRGNSMVSSWFVSHIETKGEVTAGSPPGEPKPLGIAHVAGNRGEHLFGCVESFSVAASERIVISGAREHNLKDI